MAYQLNDNIKRLVPYQAEKEEYDIKLDANESFLSIPTELVTEAVRLAMGFPTNRYPDQSAKKLCEAFADFYDIDAELVTAGNGSDELIGLIFGAFFSHDDEVMLLDMDFSMYKQYGDIYDVKTTVIPKKDDFSIDVDKIIDYALISKAKGLIFSNPCNPTSICLDKRQVMRLVNELSDCLVIVDEAYMDFSNESVIKQAEKKKNLIVLRTCSKAMGLATARIGFAVACKAITNALQAAKAPYNVNGMSQALGQAVMSDKLYLNDCIEQIIRSRDHLYNMLLSLDAHYHLIERVYPTEANFVFVKFAPNSTAFEQLKERSIIVRKFGDYLRISAGTKAENEAVCTALKEICEEAQQ